LYYILVKRLLEQKTTLFQDRANHVFLFDANGVKAISPTTFMHPKSEKYQGAWALVDINPHVQTPADMFGMDSLLPHHGVVSKGFTVAMGAEV